MLMPWWLPPGNVKVSCREGEGNENDFGFPYSSAVGLGRARAYPRPSDQTEGGVNGWISEKKQWTVVRTDGRGIFESCAISSFSCVLAPEGGKPTVVFFLLRSAPLSWRLNIVASTLCNVQDLLRGTRGFHSAFPLLRFRHKRIPSADERSLKSSSPSRARLSMTFQCRNGHWEESLGLDDSPRTFTCLSVERRGGGRGG